MEKNDYKMEDSDSFEVIQRKLDLFEDLLLDLTNNYTREGEGEDPVLLQDSINLFVSSENKLREPESSHTRTAFTLVPESNSIATVSNKHKLKKLLSLKKRLEFSKKAFKLFKRHSCKKSQLLDILKKGHSSRAIQKIFAKAAKELDSHYSKKGKIKISEKDYYIGEMIHETRAHGRGVFISSNRRIFEGEWLNNQPYGWGQESWINGSIYMGNYLNGKKNGFGIMLWKSGAYFTGIWERGKIRGPGIYKWKNGLTYHGEWEFGLKNGHGKLVFPDGSVYVGSFSRDKAHGFGMLWLKNGSKSQGVWVEGRLEGAGTYWDTEGDIQQKVFQKGKSVLN